MIFNFKGAIFDLDGVIVNTAQYHYLAWKNIAQELGFEFSEVNNEKLKGVSRMRSLEILLEVGNLSISEQDRVILAERKNNYYLKYIEFMDESEILPGAKEYILKLREQGIKTGLGSASKNALLILKRLKIMELFDVIVDGNLVSKAKPDPEVFLLSAKGLDLSPNECVVFEDAEAGVEAAINAGMKVIGIGKKENLKKADKIISGLNELL